MSLFSTSTTADRSLLRRDRSAKDSGSPRTDHVETELSLPRHLLVSLAGITTDVNRLQQQYGDDTRLHTSLEVILGRLDGLVDSIYERVSGPAAPSMHGAGPDFSEPGSDVRELVSDDVTAATNPTRPATRIERTPPDLPA
jgi:hypothetical protein